MELQKQIPTSQNLQVQSQMQKSLLDFTTSQDEKDIAIAVSKGTIISNLPMQSFLEHIAKTRMLLGMPKDYNNKEELVIATQFVHNKFGFLTTDEFDLAFDLFIMQKYDTDIQFYGMLSPLFISQVLNAYLYYRKMKLADAIRQKEKSDLQIEIEKNKPSEEKQAEDRKVVIKEFWDEWKVKGEEIKINTELSYVFFKRFKHLFKFYFDDKRIIKAQDWANKKMIQDRSKGGFFRLNEKDENLQKLNYARIWCVMDYFSRFENVDEILNLITPELW